jgi:hypothetical protein
METEENLSDMENIDNGGAIAHAKLQYVDMTTKERKEITQPLKYCELDTLAMVMIYEHFKHDIIKQPKGNDKEILDFIIPATMQQIHVQTKIRFSMVSILNKVLYTIDGVKVRL